MGRKDELLLISAIADRGMPLFERAVIGGVQKMDIMMDIEFTHEVMPLDLEGFLAFGDGDFNHDISGIYQNFNRETKQMDNCFTPRCALPEEPVSGYEMIPELLEEQIECWEPKGAEVIYTIDINEGTVERIVLVNEPAKPMQYFLYRYFMMGVAGMRTCVCSVDLNGVEADDVIQHLGERIG
jgi:hypothetical protein